MKRFLIVALALVTGSALYAQNQPIDYMHYDWAQMGRYVDANKAVEGKDIDVVFYGNSITENWARMRPEFFEKNGFVGRGISGQTTFRLLGRFRQDVIDLNPRRVVILAGINDLAFNDGIIPMENTLDNIQSMCELAQLHGIKVYLCSVLPCNRFFWRPEAGDRSADVVVLNRMLRDYANAAGIVYVNYFPAMSNGNNVMKDGYSMDGCHPTVEGYEVMEKIILDYLDR